MYNTIESCVLIRTEKHKDAIGQMVETEHRRAVLCESTAVSSAEWFNAGQIGLAAELRLLIHCSSYNGEEICEYRGQRYGIYRTYLNERQQVELYLERKAGV